MTLDPLEMYYEENFAQSPRLVTINPNPTTITEPSPAY